MFAFTASRPLIRAFTVAFAALFLAGCEEDVKLNPSFSMNLVDIGPKWPKVKNLTTPQKAVYEQYGRPDRLRILWNSEGRIMQRDELREQYKGMQPKTLPPCLWVYERRGVEIEFLPGTHRELPLSDSVRLILKHGDPEAIKQLADGVTQWTFYGAGRNYKMSGGTIIEEREFPALGRYLK